MPADVVARARTRFEVTHRDLPTPMGPDDLRTALRDYDAVLPTLGDLFKADVFADVPQPRAQILANFGVGYNHIDVTAARAAGLSVTNTPGAVTDATADIALMLILMTARRAGEGERWLAPDPDVGDARFRPHRRHHRHGPHRQGHRAALPFWLRHEGDLPQPICR